MKAKIIVLAFVLGALFMVGYAGAKPAIDKHPSSGLNKPVVTN